jgi:hypothetical protein
LALGHPSSAFDNVGLACSNSSFIKEALTLHFLLICLATLHWVLISHSATSLIFSMRFVNKKYLSVSLNSGNLASQINSSQQTNFHSYRLSYRLNGTVVITQ